MVFKRRKRRPVWAIIREFFWPKGGWARAATYVTHRLRRLPDEPHRIARGVFAGVFISFTPLFGFHLILAGLMAWMMRGNILAALLATFAGNPLTTPFVALSSVQIGQWMLGTGGAIQLSAIFAAFSHAGLELWANVLAIFTTDVTHWDRLGMFFRTIFLPYLIGGIAPGIAVSAVFYYVSIPLVRGYQKLRATKLKERIERVRTAKQAKAEAARMQSKGLSDQA